MAKLKDGFYKLTAQSIGSDLLVLLAGGGSKPIADFALASSLSDYVTLGTVLTITGLKLFTQAVTTKGRVVITGGLALEWQDIEDRNETSCLLLPRESNGYRLNYYDGTNWRWLAYSSDVDALKDYYWANVKISATSNATTKPTFSNTIVNGVLTVNGGVKTLAINHNHTLSTAWNDFIACLNPNLTTTYHTAHITFGRTYDAKNVGYIGFKYAGSASNSNMVTIGLHSVDNILNVLASGNVGIGTTNPTYKLDVNGKIRAFTEIKVQGSTSPLQLPCVNWHDENTTGFHVSYRINETGKPLRFYYQTTPSSSTTSTYTLLVDITSTGSVGIGTIAPEQKLHILGLSLLSQTANGNLYYLVKGLTYHMGFGLGGGGVNRGIYDFTDGSWMLYRDATTNVLIPKGNVGIGTTSPIHKLQVAGAGVFNNTDSTTYASNGITIGAGDAVARYITCYGKTDTSYINIGYGPGTNNSAEFAFKYTSDGSTSNCTIVSIYGAANSMKMYPGNTVFAKPLIMPGELYSGNYAINMSNSNIIGLNAIFTSDLADSGTEGYLFKRTNGNYDSIWCNDGTFYFSPNGNNSSQTGSYSTNYTIWHSGNDGAGSGLDADTLDGKHLADLNVLYKLIFNCESLSTSNFYPLFFSGSDEPLHCKILSNNRGGDHAYNQNTIEFKLSACGWSDAPVRLIVYNYGCYSNGEITIGSIGYGNRLGGVCVWVRGGSTYRVWSNRSCYLMTSNYTYGDEVYTIGTSYNGGTNTYVTILFVPQSTTASGTYTNNLIKSSGSMYAAHFYENSDAKLKTNIQNINSSNNIPILKEFDWKEDGSHSYGLIAQELEAMGYSELVDGDEDSGRTVNYSAALSLIVGKLQVKIKELEKEIEILKNKN